MGQIVKVFDVAKKSGRRNAGDRESHWAKGTCALLWGF